MGDLLDYLFCPIHGLIRPDNLVLYLASLGYLGTTARIYCQKKGWL